MVDTMPRRLRCEVLGEIPFEEGVARMRALADARARGEGEDTLLLMRHPEVVTVGRRRGARDNILNLKTAARPAAGPRRNGPEQASDTADFEIPVIEVDRGGDVTWHGPGQLVGYPVLRLTEAERDVHAVLRRLEGGLIAALETLGLRATRNPPHTGVWTDTAEGPRKVCSIGLGIRAWVAMHGFGLNVDCDLSRFATIRPCGLESEVMGSLASVGVINPWEGLEARLHHHLAVAFGRVGDGETGGS